MKNKKIWFSIFFIFIYFWFFTNINAYEFKETTIVFNFGSDGTLINSETYTNKSIREVMDLKENNYKNIQKHRLSFISGVEWYVNVQDWKNDYISLTSSLKAVGRDIYLMGVSSVDVEVVGSSGTFSEQTFKYRSPGLNTVVYASPKDMYVGNSKQITISSVGGYVYFNRGEAFTAIHGSKTFSR